MPDELDQIRHRLETAVSEAVSVAFEELRALARITEPEVDRSDASPFSDRMRPGRAAKAFGLSRTYLHDRAVEQLKVPGGFSQRDARGRYWYSQSLLTTFLEQNPPRGWHPK